MDCVRCGGWTSTRCGTCTASVCHSCSLVALVSSTPSHDSCTVPPWLVACQSIVAEYNGGTCSVTFEASIDGPSVRLAFPGGSMEMSLLCLSTDTSPVAPSPTTDGYLVVPPRHMTDEEPPALVKKPEPVKKAWVPPDDAGRWTMRERKAVNYTLLECPSDLLHGHRKRPR